MTEDLETAIDWTVLAETRSKLGDGFMRVFGYFHDDGYKATQIIEDSVKNGAPAPLVLPAHRLKNEAREFGAEGLASLAELIELSARDCVEWKQNASGLVEHIVKLRPLLLATLMEIDAEINPLVQRRANG